MVKGVSRQVIVVHSPDPKLFDQAIFILKDDAIKNKGITDEALLREAKRLIGVSSAGKRQKLRFFGPLWAAGGALTTALIWLLTALI